MASSSGSRQNAAGGQGKKKSGDLDAILRIPSQGSKVAGVRRKVADIARRFGFSDSEIFDIKVAVGEACANAVEHGSPEGRQNDVIVNCHVEGQALIIEVSDQGAFKPRFPTFDSRLNYRGRGLPFMLALMDDVEIQETEIGTTVRLVKLRKG